MAVNPVKTPFTNMSFTPDIPSSALGANEYNAGQNIETNVRGINSVDGDIYVLSEVPGNQVFVTSGFGSNGVYYWIVATAQGHWYQINQAGGITDITPGYYGILINGTTTLGTYAGITSGYGGIHTGITQKSTSGVGSGAIFSVTYAGTSSGIPYSTLVGLGQLSVTITTGGNSYAAGDTITISGASLGGVDGTNDLTFTVSGTFGTSGVGTFTGYSASTVITASWNGTVVFLNDQINPPMYFSPGNWGSIRLYDNAPDDYIWNYDVGYNSGGDVVPLYSSLTAGFVRVYNSPNVGSLLIAGNFTGNINANVVPSGGTVQNLPTSVRWSQNFGINAGPTTWAPTITNVANQVEMPVRGQVVDGFSLNGNFYICSYWDTCVMSPIAYQNNYAPVFGIKIVSQGRGLINENCWAVVDNTAYGVDARDIWKFDGGSFVPMGNQRIKDYFYSNLNTDYTNQIFMINNTSKYQIEIYYPDLTSTGRCNQMLAYRYDQDVWQPPRQVTLATAATESPRIIDGNVNLATRGVVYSTYTTDGNLVQKDTGTSFIGNTAITSLFQRNNISFGQPYSASVQVHRVLPEVYGTGNVNITVGGADSVDQDPTYKPTETMEINTSDPWVQIDQNEARVITLKVGHTSNVDQWQLTAANWQTTVVQDTR